MDKRCLKRCGHYQCCGNQIKPESHVPWFSHLPRLFSVVLHLSTCITQQPPSISFPISVSQTQPHACTHTTLRLFSATESQVDVFVAKVITAIWSTEACKCSKHTLSYTHQHSHMCYQHQISYNIDWQAVCRHQQHDGGQRLYSGGTSKEIVV